jgi:hypothetical protein
VEEAARHPGLGAAVASEDLVVKAQEAQDPVNSMAQGALFA